MKYLKKFENIKDEYKKYVIYKSIHKSIDYLFILEVINQNEHFINVRKLYRYYNEYTGDSFGIIGLEELDRATLKFTPERMNDVIYQSDNMQDCLDVLPELISAIKYNI